MKHVICSSRLNYQDTLVNQRLIELKADAKAAQKNGTGSKFANTSSTLLTFLFGKHEKLQIIEITHILHCGL